MEEGAERAHLGPDLNPKPTSSGRKGFSAETVKRGGNSFLITQFNVSYFFFILFIDDDVDDDA